MSLPPKFVVGDCISFPDGAPYEVAVVLLGKALADQLYLGRKIYTPVVVSFRVTSVDRERGIVTITAEDDDDAT